MKTRKTKTKPAERAPLINRWETLIPIEKLAKVTGGASASGDSSGTCTTQPNLE